MMRLWHGNWQIVDVSHRFRIVHMEIKFERRSLLKFCFQHHHRVVALERRSPNGSFVIKNPLLYLTITARWARYNSISIHSAAHMYKHKHARYGNS